MCCDSFSSNVYQFINNTTSSLSVIIQSTHYSEFCKSLSEFYVALVGVVGLLAVYRIQFFENNIKDSKVRLIRYASALKEFKESDHDIEWYSYMDDSELHSFIKDEVIPKHQKDFKYHEECLKSILDEYTKRFQGQEGNRAFLVELERVWEIINKGKGVARAYKNLSFNSPSVAYLDINLIHKHVHDIRMSSSKIDAFQRRMSAWNQTKRTWEHFKLTCYRLLIALILLFTCFFILHLLFPIKYILPSGCIKFFKYILWIFGFVSILGSSFYFKKFIYICLEKEKVIPFLGILP